MTQRPYCTHCYSFGHTIGDCPTLKAQIKEEHEKHTGSEDAGGTGAGQGQPKPDKPKEPGKK